MSHVDAGLAQYLARADTRNLQQMRRRDRPRAQNHFAPRAEALPAARTRILDAAGALAVEQNALAQRAGDHLQVGPLARRLQIGIGGRPAHPVFDRHVHRAKAFLLTAVVIIGLHISRLRARIDECAVQRVLHVVTVVDRKRTVLAAVGIAAESPVVGLAEVWQAVAIAPVRAHPAPPIRRSPSRGRVRTPCH